MRHRQLLHDIVANPVGGRCRERDDRRASQRLAQGAQVAVVRAEVMPPLGDAVGLVDRDQPDVDGVEKVAKARNGQALRRDVEQLEPARPGRGIDAVGLARRHRAVDERRRDAIRPQRVHLILHQSDQRRDDQRQPVQTQRRQLIAQRLAPTGGHQHQRVPTRQHIANDLGLQRDETRHSRSRAFSTARMSASRIARIAKASPTTQSFWPSRSKMVGITASPRATACGCRSPRRCRASSRCLPRPGASRDSSPRRRAPTRSRSARWRGRAA